MNTDNTNIKWGVLNLTTGYSKAIPETDEDYNTCTQKGLTKAQATKRVWDANQQQITHERSIMEQDNIDLN